MSMLIRFGAMMLAAAASISMAVSVAAAPIIDQDAEGSITIHKYAVDDTDIFETPANGLAVDDNEEIAKKDGQSITLNDLTPLSNVTFRVTKVNDDATDPEQAVKAGQPATAVTGTDGTAQFAALAIGTYLVEELDNAAVKAPISSFLVSIPMTDPLDGDSWIYDIHVYPKNELSEGPGIDKFVTELDNKHDTASLNDNVTWIITAEIPADIENSLRYLITDQLDEKLVLVNGSVVLTAVDQDGFEINLTENVHYTVNTNSGLLTIELLDAGRAALGAAVTDPAQSPLPQLTIEFKTELSIADENLEESLGKAIENGAHLGYTDNTGNEYESDVTEKPEVHTGGFNILKVDGSDKTTPLENAEFLIYTSLQDALDGRDPLTVPGAGTVWVLSTDEYGRVHADGLPFGAFGEEITDHTATSYWIVEVKSPIDENGNHYNLLDEPVEVKVTAASHLKENPVTVENNKGVTLPNTGGIGTLLFTVAGLLLLGSASLLYFVSKKKKESK